MKHKKIDKNAIINSGWNALAQECADMKPLISNNKLKMQNLLLWLSGKKSIIAGIITTTSAYLVDMGTIDARTGIYIAALSLIIFGTASIATTEMYKNL